MREFESYATLHDFDDKEDRKIAAFHLHFHDPALTWFNSLNTDISWEALSQQFKNKYINIDWKHPSVFVENELFQNLQLSPNQDIEDYYGQLYDKGQLLNKPDHEIMGRFIRGLPEKLAFYVRAYNPTDCNSALIFAKAGEAYKYRQQEK